MKILCKAKKTCGISNNFPVDLIQSEENELMRIKAEGSDGSKFHYLQA